MLAKLEAKGLKPAAPADKRTLIRRATLDLTGLPPTHEEVNAFEADKAPNAYEKVVDRLLASPATASAGAATGSTSPATAMTISAASTPAAAATCHSMAPTSIATGSSRRSTHDITYDQFVRMQLAGDLMSKNPTQDELEATGFLGGAPWIWDQAEPVQGRADERNERIDAVTRGMLGLTVACARCHDHKYDPILAKDYYALGGIFASTTYKEYAIGPGG